MSKLFCIAALFLLCAMHSAAENYSAWWQKGNDYYTQKQYDSAAFYYEQIAAVNPRNADIYYNLGNTYYRLNKIAPAVLNYERALALNPDYTAARENLQLTQNRINGAIQPARDIFFIRWWDAATRADKANSLAVISLCLFVLLVGVLLFNRLRKAGEKRIPREAVIVLGITFFCFLLVAGAAALNATAHDRAVVMQADVPLMNNSLKGKPLTLVPEGTTLKIRQDKGEWAEVTLPDGRTGWIQQSTLDRI